MFPDASRRLVPITWTDAGPTGATERGARPAARGFLKTPRPAPTLWKTLEDEWRIAVLDVVERRIVQAARPEPETQHER